MQTHFSNTCRAYVAGSTCEFIILESLLLSAARCLQVEKWVCRRVWLPNEPAGSPQPPLAQMPLTIREAPSQTPYTPVCCTLLLAACTAAYHLYPHAAEVCAMVAGASLMSAAWTFANYMYLLVSATAVLRFPLLTFTPHLSPHSVMHHWLNITCQGM